MDCFELKVFGIYKTFYDGEALQIQLPTIDGLRGILAHHEPAVVGIVPGTIRIQKPDGSWLTAVTDSGFARVKDSKVRVMVEEILLPEEIDEQKERARLEKAKDELKQRSSALEYQRAEASIQRSLARLNVKGKSES